MPLKKGKSDAVFSANVAEILRSYKKKGTIGSSKPKTVADARRQALAIAYAKKRGN